MGGWQRRAVWLVMPLLHVSLACSAQDAQRDLGEDITFEVRPLARVHLKSGLVLKGRVVGSDADWVRLKRGSVILPVSVSEIARTEPERPPEVAVALQFAERPERLAGIARAALRAFPGNPKVEEVVKERLRRGAEAGDADAMAVTIGLLLNERAYGEAETVARLLVEREASGYAHALLGRALAGRPGHRAAADDSFSKALERAPRDEAVMMAAAEHFLDSGRARRAGALFASVLERRPGDLPASTGVGLASLRRGDFDQASAHFKQVREAALPADRSQRHYIRASLGLAATRALQGAFAETRQLAGEVLAIDAGNASALGLQAYALLMAGEDESRALTLADAALAGEPCNPRLQALKAAVLTRGGELLRTAGRPEEGKARFEEAAALLGAMEGEDTCDSWATYFVAHGRFEQGDYEKALSGFRRVVEMQPAYAPAYQAVGAASLALKKWAEAGQAYGEAITIDGNESAYHAGLGLSLLGGGRIVEAREALKNALQMDRTCLEALCGLGYIACRENNEPAMRDLFHRALAVDGECAYAVEALRRVYASQGAHLTCITFQDDVPADWRVTPGVRRLRPQVQDGALVWRGSSGVTATQRIEFGTSLRAEEFVRLEADLEVAPAQTCVFALRVSVALDAGDASWVEFGKCPGGQLAYRFRSEGRALDWTPIAPWPETGKIRLGIESLDLATGRIRLCVDGEPRLTGTLASARMRRVTVGVFVQAPANVEVEARADNIVFPSRKAVEAEPQRVPFEPVEPVAPRV